MKTLEQKRSNYAFDCISKIKRESSRKEDRSFEKNVSSLISKLGTLILTNGLGNTLAFLFAKGKDHHLEVIKIISNWLFEQKGQNFNITIDDLKNKNIKDEKIKEIMENLVLEASVEQYMYYTEETLRLVNWLRRFSDAILESGGENE